MKSRKRKPVIRLFLIKHYATISVILLSVAALIIAGIAGWIIDDNGTLMPIHTPLIIIAAILGILGFGLIWIYDEDSII